MINVIKSINSINLIKSINMIVLINLVGCRVDLQVGTDPAPPASLETSAPTFRARVTTFEGSIADAGFPDAGAGEAVLFSVEPNPGVMCADALGGQEAAFSSVTAADVSLSSGPLTYEHATDVRISGDVLLDPFGVVELRLESDVVPDQPLGTYLAAVPVNGPEGPESTQVTLAALYVDTTVSPPRGEAGFQYENAGGACFVSFRFSLPPE